MRSCGKESRHYLKRLGVLGRHAIQCKTLGDVAGNLKMAMSSLRRWTREKFGAVMSELEKNKETHGRARGQDLGIGSSEMRGLRQRMDELLYCEELMWLQRSCITWLKEGHQNTKYFHRKAVGRAKRTQSSY
jgi:hypothetical protein